MLLLLTRERTCFGDEAVAEAVESNDDVVLVSYEKFFVELEVAITHLEHLL